MPNSFGQVIPVLGPLVGFPGQWSRTDDTIIVAKPVLPTTTNPLKFGDGAVVISSATGGNFQSLADFLATASNAQYLMQYFGGVAVRNVKVLGPYSGYGQNPAAAVATTGTASSGSTALTVASGTGIAVGMAVEGAGIAPNTLVSAVSGTSVTLSLATTAALSTTNVSFSTAVPSFLVGSYAQGLEAEVLVRSSVTVPVNAGTPQANQAVYIRTVANASTPGTSVGDFEAADETATSSITVGTTLGSTSITTSASTGLAIGQRVTGAYFAPNTYITAGSGTSWTISQPAVATVASGGAATFLNTALLGSLADPWLVFKTGQIDSNNLCEITIKGRHAA